MTNIQKDGWKKSYITKWFQEDEICHFCTLCQQKLLQFHCLCVCVCGFTHALDLVS